MSPRKERRVGSRDISEGKQRRNPVAEVREMRQGVLGWRVWGRASTVATTRRQEDGREREGLGRVKSAASVDIQGRCPAGSCCPLHLQHAWTPQFFKV